jgi:pimeloyl-ACP methyl ester carboxylesterase
VCFGFKRVQSQKVPGVTGWYRPSSTQKNTSQQQQQQSRIPMIFFHGIAPAGVFFYLPMLLLGSDIVTTDRCCLLIDNYNIACTLNFDAVSEREMVSGVQDLIDTYLPNPSTTPIAVCGHSFGSCVVSWLFHHGSSQLRQQIQLCIVLDPVTILLSDPDVVNNFLYSRTLLSIIRMFASSEICTEYYLRHQFSWYNSEVWLEEILQLSSVSPALSSPSRKYNDNLHVIVGLSDCDLIVNAPKVKRHIDLVLQRNPTMDANRLRTMYWNGAGHANCLKSRSKWQHIQRTICECEYSIATRKQA